MPIAHFHLVDPTPGQCRRIIEEATRIYAEAFESPADRIRIFVQSYPSTAVGVGGVVVADGATQAPFFTALAMAGRPVRQRHRVLEEFTALLAEVLDVDPGSVRGHVVDIDPENWGIGGQPASVLRAAELAARAESS